MPYPSLAFTLAPSTPKFGPRVGQLTFTRHDDDAGTPKPDQPVDKDEHEAVQITLDTPNMLVGTSRGVVPHLSRDHANTSDAIRWLNVPFESFLEQAPPVPTLQRGPYPLHRFLGFDEKRQVASLCLRNPLDVREMPPNGNTFVCANCVRGVKKVSLADWRKYVYEVQPDIVFALTDTPFTPPPFSQKRMTKSIERSAVWLVDLLQRRLGDDMVADSDPPRLSGHPLNVFVHMAGGLSLPAREAFAYSLTETLHGPDSEAIKPLRCLDEGVSGYAFDLAVLRGIHPSPNNSQHQSLPDGFLELESPHMLQHPELIVEVPTPSVTDEVGSIAPKVLLAKSAPRTGPQNLALMLKTSLGELSERKPRLATGVRSPHEMLRLVRDVGVDLFDAGWAMNAADVGVALDFVFPVPPRDEAGSGRAPVGHNLYDPVYARQFRRLADGFVGAGESAAVEGQQVCVCIACSPRALSAYISHSTVDRQSYATTDGDREGEERRYEKPYSRAYVHHLLHTHEMSAHTFLVAHNLAVVSEFLAGVRRVWMTSGTIGFALEVDRFTTVYEEGAELLVAAKRDWECVDRARGKGRLAREREKEANGRTDADDLGDA